MHQASFLRRVTLVAVTLLACCCSACELQAAGDITQLTGRTMGTTFHVLAVLPEEGDSAQEVGQRITDRLKRVNQAMSTFIADSELSRFNRSTDINDWFTVSPATALVVTYALSLAQDSGGAFDPTLGPVIDLWGFGSKGHPPRPPTDEELATALASTGYTKVQVRSDPPALKKSVAELQLNLSAVAKGYGVDAVCEELQAADCKAYMVEIGGEVRTLGRKPNGTTWKIGVEQPDPQAEGYQRIVALTDQAMATSGDYRNFFEHEGQRYSHSIDPTTGWPVRHSLATVTVIASTCMEADALATAILVQGPQQGFAWAEKRGLAALLVERLPKANSASDAFHEQATTTWPQPADSKPIGNKPASNKPTPTSTPTSPEKSSHVNTFLVAAVVFLLAMGGMALGVMLSGRRIQGSCGGLGGLRDSVGNPLCENCSNPGSCDNKKAPPADSSDNKP